MRCSPRRNASGVRTRLICGPAVPSGWHAAFAMGGLCFPHFPWTRRLPTLWPPGKGDLGRLLRAVESYEAFTISGSEPSGVESTFASLPKAFWEGAAYRATDDQIPQAFSRIAALNLRLLSPSPHYSP